MPFVACDGIKLHHGDSGAGPVILLIHGYTGTSWNWALNVPELAKEYRCITIDLPGHGPSDKPQDSAFFELGHMADVVFRALGALEIEKCFLVGHSMGGMIAEYMALDHQDSFLGLALISTSAEAVDIGGATAPNVLLAAEENGMKAAFEERLAALPTEEERARYRQYRSGSFLSMTAAAMLACAHAMANRVSLMSRLPEIHLPTLIMCGSEDTPFLPQAKLMHESIPRSDLKIFPGVAHNLPFDAPEAFNGALLDFLGAHRPQ